MNTPVVGLSSSSAAEDNPATAPEHSEHEAVAVIEDIDDAIAVATTKLSLMPGTAFQARVSQLAQLNVAHRTVSSSLR